jgi:hypothetical protein
MSEYEVIVGPPAYSAVDYPDEPAVQPTHHHAVTLLVAVVAAVAVLGVLLWWIGGLPNNLASPAVPAPTAQRPVTETVETPAPPTTKWLVPDVPDAGTSSVDARFIATLARHGVGPAPGVSQQTMIDGAHGICGMIGSGWTQQQVVDALVDNQIQVTPLQAKMIVVTAVDLYCHN